MRLGIFGGTFDPVHMGHLAVAEQARVALKLDRLLLVPAGRPPHKPGQRVSAAEDRLAMVRAAVAGNAAFAASDLELRRPGPSYTADTLAEVSRLHPGAELFCLIGSDSAVELDTWHDPQRLYAQATFVALLRPGWPRARIDAWLGRQPAGARPRLCCLSVPGLDVSSSDLRRRVADGGSVRYLVPDGVRRLIRERGLYLPQPPGDAAAPTVESARSAVYRRLSPLRAAHCERVAATARALAARHGMDAEAATLAGWLHDWCREVPDAELLDLAGRLGVLPSEGARVVPATLHGPVAAELLREAWPGLQAKVLQAIDRHTTGDAAMTAFDCLLLVADLIEPAHGFAGVQELRSTAEEDLWAAARAAMDASLGRLVASGRAVDPRTVEARNALLARRRAAAGRAADPVRAGPRFR